MSVGIDKICPICGKKTRYLTAHLSNMHPNIVKKMAEMEENEPVFTENEFIFTENEPKIRAGTPVSNARKMIFEHLDTVLAVHLAKVVSNLDATPQSFKALSEIVNPPPQTQLKDFLEFYKTMKGVESPITEGNGWSDVALAAVPMVTEMIKGIKPAPAPIKKPDFVKTRPEDLGGVTEIVRERKSGIVPSSGSVQCETSRNTRESIDTTKEPSNNSTSN